jgi:hypothetical protein
MGTTLDQYSCFYARVGLIVHLWWVGTGAKAKKIVMVVIVFYDAHKSSIKLLECGDLIQDSSGNYLSSLECKVGSWDALYVEMWNMYI